MRWRAAVAWLLDPHLYPIRPAPPPTNRPPSPWPLCRPAPQPHLVCPQARLEHPIDLRR